MFPALQEYHRPQSIAQALELLSRPEVPTAVLAGGTELNGRTDLELAAVVDLAGLGLDQLEVSAGGLRVGAMVTLQTLTEAPEVQPYATGLLGQAARSSAPRTIRQAATVGGTLAGAKGGDDLPTALTALDARVILAITDGIWQVPVGEYLAGRGAADGTAALITEVALPALPEGARGAFVKISRTPSDRAIVCAAAVMAVDRHGACRHLRLALGGVGPHPVRLQEVESRLTGQPVTADRIARAAELAAEHLGAAVPETYKGDFRASAEYRRWVAPVLARRALTAAWHGEGEGVPA